MSRRSGRLWIKMTILGSSAYALALSATGALVEACATGQETATSGPDGDCQFDLIGETCPEPTGVGGAGGQAGMGASGASGAGGYGGGAAG